MDAGLIFVIAWFACAALTFRPMFRSALPRLDAPDWGDVAAAAFTGGLVALVCGPIIVARTLFMGSVGRKMSAAQFARVIGGESKAQKEKRLANEAREREAYIKRLEREVGLQSLP